MKKGIFLLTTILIILFAVSLLTQAEQNLAIPVEFSDFSPEAITINFDSLPDGTSIPNIVVPPYSGVITNPDSIIDDEYASLGVIFTSVETGAVAVDDFTTQIQGISPPNSLIGTSDSTHFNTGGPIFVCFVDPLTGLPSTTTQVGTFSIDVDIAPVSFIAYDSQGNEVGRTYFSVGGNGSIDFAGLRYDEGIASIAINVPRSDWLAIDNFIFEPVAPAIIPITIDIKPGSCPNSINPKAGGVISVAILTTADFDASTVDPQTVALEGTAARGKGKSGRYGSMEDVDGDGDLDLVVQIENDIEWDIDATEATLTGETYDGIPIQGTDTVNIVPPE
jgi:hypothetical protein